MDKNGATAMVDPEPKSRRRQSSAAQGKRERAHKTSDSHPAAAWDGTKAEDVDQKIRETTDTEIKKQPDTKEEASSPESTIIIGPFQVDPTRLLGEGSYASVCVAKHLEDGKTYACKIINEKKNMGNFVDRFLPRELKLIRKFNSERVTCVHGIFKTHNLFYIVMDHCENGDLLRYLQRRGRALEEEETREKSLQILMGIRYLHEEQQIAHRDLKCENILIDSSSKLKLGDFGFARSVLPLADSSEMDQNEIREIREFMRSEVGTLSCLKAPTRSRRASEKAALSNEIARLNDKAPAVSSSGTTSTTSTQRSPKGTAVSGQHPVASSTFCGSVAYAAPEVLSRKSYDPKKYDMWSTGVIIFIMACFFMPFDDSDQAKMVRRQMAKKWRYPQDAQISEPLKEFLEGMMEPNPKDRHSISDALRHKWLRRQYREVLLEEQKNEQSRA
ncbi:testis-specific serine/threonine-protein kinase 1-like isoform X1 [Paramacrobiotus metropolitanus]|uniref:testis-specific serine/threonine-protein kinase 1-like isoform X1 n=1 Tax=Paramacrobiotus metropolitanus TaxID=2943436 RepID=UPI002446329A|nr:testis-specific serine/threonine-protein kinase 1-like isoform X1 [Paramacrobiotus metropolitanus]